MCVSKELVNYYFVAMTYKGAMKTSEFNDNIWVKWQKMSEIKMQN
jgi:hypothetical protein